MDHIQDRLVLSDNDSSNFCAPRVMPRLKTLALHGHSNVFFSNLGLSGCHAPALQNLLIKSRELLYHGRKFPPLKFENLKNLVILENNLAGNILPLVKANGTLEYLAFQPSDFGSGLENFNLDDAGAIGDAKGTFYSKWILTFKAVSLILMRRYECRVFKYRK